MGKYPRHINYDYGQYTIMKSIDGKITYFGRFTTLEEAVNERDHLIKHDWNKRYSKYYKYKQKPIKQRNPSQHIYKLGLNYTIYKSIAGKTLYYGSYFTLEEAEIMRDKLVECDWDMSLVPFRRKHHPRNPISKHIKCVNDKYVLTKWIDGTQIHFGTYSTFEEAKQERTFWEEINWDINKLDLY